MFVGNHSGGAGVPDTFVFLLAYNTYMTVEGRPLHSLGHEMVTSLPCFGTIARRLRRRDRRAGRRHRRSSTPTPPCSSTRAATSRRCGRGATATG